MTVLLQLTDLCVQTPERTLVDGVSLQVVQGRVTALIGHSGSGKSLSARAAMGVLDVIPGLLRGSLIYPGLSNRDWFESVRGNGMKAQQRLLRETQALRGSYITYSPQSASSALNPGRTIGRQLELAIQRRKTPASNIGQEVASVLADVGLPGRTAAALPRELSGGQAQRAALAIAIAPRPSILIADEPETGLDPVLRRVVTELMIECAKGLNLGLLLISHNLDTVKRVADDVVTIGLPGARQ